MKCSEGPLPEDLRYDTRLVLVRRTMEFYLCLLSPLKVRGDRISDGSIDFAMLWTSCNPG